MYSWSNTVPAYREALVGVGPLPTRRQAEGSVAIKRFVRAPQRARVRAGRAATRVATLMALLLAAPVAHGQDALGLLGQDLPVADAVPESEMRARVAAEFPEARLVRFRKVRPMAVEASHEVAFCGQVSATPPEQREPNFHLFLYGRTAEAETVRILGSESLNGYRVGRKLIGALRRIGCL